MTNDRGRIFSHNLTQFGNSQYTFLCFLLSLQTMSLYIDMKMIRPGNCSGSHLFSVIIFWISATICNVVNPGKSSARTPSAPRQYDPIAREFINQSIFPSMRSREYQGFFPCTILIRRTRRLSLLTTELLGPSTESSFFQDFSFQLIRDIP